jgi:hypothetical protein
MELAFPSREISERYGALLGHPNLPHVCEASARSRRVPLVRGRGRVSVQWVWRVQRSVGNRPTREDAAPPVFCSTPANSAEGDHDSLNFRSTGIPNLLPIASTRG